MSLSDEICGCSLYRLYIVYNRGQHTPEVTFCYIDIGSIDNENQRLNTNETVLSPEEAPSRARKIVDLGDILYSTVRPYLHNMCIIDRQFSHAPIASTGFAAMTCHTGIFNQYLFYYLMSPSFDSYANDTENSKGVAYPAINDARLYHALIPIPPENEQKRIVDRLAVLQPFVTKYKGAEETLGKLNADFPEQLKKSILQMAVQGKLVPQDPNDEPASVLLERIRDEKEHLIAEGKIKRDKNESVIFRRDNSHYEKRGGNETCIDDEISFDLPDSWAWCRLRTICHDMRYGTAKKSSSSGQVAVLRMGNIQDGEIEYSKLVYSNDQIDNTNLLLQEHDILFNRTNSRELVGKTAIYRGDIPAIFAGYLVLIRPIIIDPEYLNYIMNSQYEWLYCQNVRSDGINQSNVSASKIGEFLIPIPPIEEQKRIVSKLVEVLPLTKEHLPKFSL